MCPQHESNRSFSAGVRVARRGLVTAEAESHNATSPQGPGNYWTNLFFEERLGIDVICQKELTSCRMNTADTHEAEANFFALLARVEADRETIVICRDGKPIAKLVPHRRISRIKPHPQLSKIKIGYDPVESLGGDEWPDCGRY